MNTLTDCIPCIVSAISGLVKLYTEDEGQRETLMKNALRMLAEADMTKNPVILSRGLIESTLEKCGGEDPFLPLKRERNRRAWEILPFIKEKITSSKDPLHTAALAAAAGNILDFVAMGNNYRLEQAIEEVFRQGFSLDCYAGFSEHLKHSETIFYVGDNTGEIVMDRPLIEELKRLGKKITYCVRGKPAMDDALAEDYYLAKLDELTDLTDTGKGYMGLVLPEAPKETIDIFNRSDMIIAKGMGNFETLSELNDRRIFFILKAKCNRVAGMLGVKNGEYCLRCGNGDRG